MLRLVFWHCRCDQMDSTQLSHFLLEYHEVCPPRKRASNQTYAALLHCPHDPVLPLPNIVLLIEEYAVVIVGLKLLGYLEAQSIL